MRRISHLIQVIRKISSKVTEDRIDAYSAQSAFFVLLGFIPFVMLLLTLLQYTPMTEYDMLELISGFFPKEFHVYLEDVVDSVYTKSTFLLSGTILAAVWACSRAMFALSRGLNTIYGIRGKKNYFVARIRAALHILLLLVSLVLAVGLFVFGNQIHDFLLKHFVWMSVISWLIIIVRTIGTVVVLSLAFGAIYTLLPYHRRPFLTQMPGAVVAAIAWSVYSYGFSIYLQYFAGRSAIYGSLTIIVMVMLWLYFCMWLLFLGAEINVYLEKSEKISYFS